MIVSFCGIRTVCFFPKERIVLAKHMQAFRFSKQLCHDQCHADEAVLPLTLEGFEANTKRALRSNPSPSGIQFHLKSARHGKIGNEIRKNCIQFFLLPGISFFWQNSFTGGTFLVIAAVKHNFVLVYSTLVQNILYLPWQFTLVSRLYIYDKSLGSRSCAGYICIAL